MGLAQGWKRDAFRATLLTYFLLLMVWMLTCYALAGLLKTGNLQMGAAALLPALVAALLGRVAKGRASEGFFRYAVIIVIILAGLSGLIQRIVRLF